MEAASERASGREGEERLERFHKDSFMTIRRGSVAIARATIGTSLEASR